MKLYLAAYALAAAGCAASIAPDPGLESLSLARVAPDTIVPGTKLVLGGDSFVDDQWGIATLKLSGQANGASVDVSWPATFVDFSTMTVAIDAGKLDQVGAAGGSADFHGTAIVEIVATSNNQAYDSRPITVDLAFRATLMPAVTGLLDGVHFVNDEIAVDGDGFLLGGDEGTTIARVSGCFQPDAGGGCAPVPTQDLPLVPTMMSRKHGTFPFSPKIAGIQPGTFTGQVTLVDKQPGKPEVKAEPVDGSFTLVTSQVFSVDPPAASLGQYVFVHGGGFVGGDPGALTELELKGAFTRTGGTAVQIDMTLIPEFVEGTLVRYVLNTDDTLGHALDLRKDTGSFTGTITPIVSYGTDTVKGIATQASLGIAPIRQVVFLNFETSYIEGLRDFGMRAVNDKIRDRIVAVCKAAYAGINMDFRTTPVTDFALFSNVELVGVDPNAMGLFGYDNSPGKDNGNERLYDSLGGVNAQTQQDGYPGFGGVFVRSLMGFSQHPAAGEKSTEGADPMFDTLFDPFREDRGGTAITSADLAGGVPVLTRGDECPAKDRAGQVACAIFVMGNLVGGTLSHEIGHSLGLANPYQDGFHDAGDQPNRLMDAGGDRPFLERAELGGQGPGVFCDDEYSYLRMILPSSDPASTVARPGCF